jgi:hypothetical protein
MHEFLLLFLRCLFASFQSHSGLVLENLALRHQLAVLKRQARKPKLRSADRLFWVGLWPIWPHWQQALLLFSLPTRQNIGAHDVAYAENARSVENASFQIRWQGIVVSIKP